MSKSTSWIWFTASHSAVMPSVIAKVKHHTPLIESMLTTGFLPLITKPTRITDHSATLIDHIYSNTKSQIYKSGILITDVADHFDTFHVNSKKAPTNAPKYKYIRPMKPDNLKNLQQILSLTDFGSVLATECPNGAYNKFLDIYDNAFNLAIPTKIIKLNRGYIKREPWVTKGLLNSSIIKLKLLRAKIRKPSEHSKHKYTEFCKVFNCIKRSAKSNYYTDIFAININNIKRTWELLRQTLHTQTKRSQLNDTFLIGNNETNSKEEISNGFNTFFTNIGTNISDKIIQPCQEVIS